MASRQVVVLVYELAAGPGDDSFTTVALGGPFETDKAARRALQELGWVARGGEFALWQAPRKRSLNAEILIAGDLPAG
jgi:hypothetical protein